MIRGEILLPRPLQLTLQRNREAVEAEGEGEEIKKWRSMATCFITLSMSLVKRVVYRALLFNAAVFARPSRYGVNLYHAPRLFISRRWLMATGPKLASAHLSIDSSRSS